VDDLGKLIGLVGFLGILYVLLRLDEIFFWLDVHKFQILTGVLVLVGIFILILWIQSRKNKALMIKEKERNFQLERINNEKRNLWREEDVHQALNIGINTIDIWHKQGLSTKELGDRFEKRMASHFRLDNYKVQEIGGSGDGGVDLILTSDTGRKIIVQCKCYNKKKVDPQDVSRTLAAVHLRKADEGWIITDSYLSQQAKSESRQLGIIFWERDRLIVELDRKRNEVINFINKKAI
jgi:hypothetical protein